MVTAKRQINSANFIPLAEGDSCCVAPIQVDTEKLAGRVKVLSALADVTRLGIVTMLAGCEEPLCVCEIVDGFKLGQPTISHHLRILREAGLIDCEKRGLWVYYWLKREVMSEISSYVGVLSAS